jgi:hypothetical protein
VQVFGSHATLDMPDWLWSYNSSKRGWLISLSHRRCVCVCCCSCCVRVYEGHLCWDHWGLCHHHYWINVLAQNYSNSSASFFAGLRTSSVITPRGRYWRTSHIIIISRPLAKLDYFSDGRPVRGVRV